MRVHRSICIVFLMAILVGLFFSGCDFLPEWRDKIRGTAIDTATTVKEGVENLNEQAKKTKESVDKKVQDVQDAIKKVNDAVDAVKKVGQ